MIGPVLCDQRKDKTAALTTLVTKWTDDDARLVVGVATCSWGRRVSRVGDAWPAHTEPSAVGVVYTKD